MDTLLHGKFGNILGKDIKKKGYRIHVGYFTFGNMLPDLSPYYRFSSHEKETNFRDVIKLMEELIFKNHILSLKSISIKLGMVVHYLCDFFTFPHNKGFNESIIKHEFYEQTQRIQMWSKLEKIWDEYSRETSVNLRTFEDIINYIEDMHLIYNNNISSKERDIYFMSILSRVICYSLLELGKNYSYVGNKVTGEVKISCL